MGAPNRQDGVALGVQHVVVSKPWSSSADHGRHQQIVGKVAWYTCQGKQRETTILYRPDQFATATHLGKDHIVFLGTFCIQTVRRRIIH